MGVYLDLSQEIFTKCAEFRLGARWRTGSCCRGVTGSLSVVHALMAEDLAERAGAAVLTPYGRAG